jgi:uncharacterized membrane protein
MSAFRGEERTVAIALTNFQERINVGRVERWLSMVAGGALAAYALKRREVPEVRLRLPALRCCIEARQDIATSIRRSVSITATS